jgi:hypothetical protein
MWRAVAEHARRTAFRASCADGPAWQEIGRFASDRFAEVPRQGRHGQGIEDQLCGKCEAKKINPFCARACARSRGGVGPGAQYRRTVARPRAAIPDDSLKSMAISSDDVHDNSGSHAESLNRFARVGNRPNESDH